MKKIEANDTEAQSADIVADNLSQLKALFPEAFAEGKVQFETLRQLLGGAVDESDEKYGLNWHGKRRARQIALTPSTGTLRPCPEESAEWDTTQNLMIEGDNLEVLKLLQKSYAGKVKLIYIDPPYNTGKDFVYSDNFRDNIGNYLELTGQTEGRAKVFANTESNGRFHTDWLTMIYPRLKLARNLLRNDGVILISIDDAELSNLRAVCNEIFGEENQIACLVWEKGRKNDAKLFSVGHEYVLVYAKSLAHLRELKTLWREEKPGAREIWEEYLKLRKQHGDQDRAIEVDLQNWFSSLPKTHPSKKWSRYKRVDKNGPWRDDNISWPGGGGPTYDVPHPKTGLPCKVPERGWVFASYSEMKKRIDAGVIEFRDDHTSPPLRKSHIRPIPIEFDEPESVETDADESDDENEQEEMATQVRGSYFYKQSQVSVKLLRSLMGAKVFNNPKDHSELARLFDYVCGRDKDAIIMDFFAGSGSSGHAVIDLNLSDDGRRRYILIQLPEYLDSTKKEQKASAKYCEKLGKPTTIAELTKERLRRASREAANSNPQFQGDLGFRVFKLDKSNIREWNPRPENVAQSLLDHSEHVLDGRTEADIVYELLLKLGLDLCVPMESRAIAGKTVGAVGSGVLMLCLAEQITAAEVESLAEGIVAWHVELAPAGDATVLFRDSAFADNVAKTNIAAILAQNGLENVRSL